MFRYEFIGSNVISINLKNGYSINAITKWDRDENTYRMSLYLKVTPMMFGISLKKRIILKYIRIKKHFFLM